LNLQNASDGPKIQNDCFRSLKLHLPVVACINCG
jgi:hypothetical protein